MIMRRLSRWNIFKIQFNSIYISSSIVVVENSTSLTFNALSLYNHGNITVYVLRYYLELSPSWKIENDFFPKSV